MSKNYFFGLFIYEITCFLTKVHNIDLRFPDEAAAEKFFFEEILKSSCQECGGFSRRNGNRITCLGECKARTSLVAKTWLKNTKVPLRNWLIAIWHIHLETSPIAARHFARKYEMLPSTADIPHPPCHKSGYLNWLKKMRILALKEP